VPAFEIVPTPANVNAVGPNGLHGGSARCPAGKRVVSGGFNLASDWARYLTVISNYPDAATESWVVQFRNNTSLTIGVPVNVTVFAVCVGQ
jgi:hypothetical protein